MRSQSVCLRSTLFRCWIAGCGKILSTWAPLSSVEDPSPGQCRVLQHTAHTARSGSAQELRTSRSFIAMLLNVNTSMGSKQCSQHTDCSCLILHTNKNCIQFLVQNTQVEKNQTCYYHKGRNSPAQFAGLVMQDAATLRPITTCISVAPKWQEHTGCVFHALHQNDTTVTVYFHKTEGKFSFCNTSRPWTQTNRLSSKEDPIQQAISRITIPAHSTFPYRGLFKGAASPFPISINWILKCLSYRGKEVWRNQ